MQTTVPNITFKTRVRDESVDGPNPFRWQDVTSDEIFSNRRVIVFGLPGAFTPTCSSTHAPGFEQHYDEIRQHNIDDIYCLSVNDAFVMFQWGKNLGVENVKMLPDGNADFTRQLGMLVDKRNLGFGLRSWRYAMVVNNGEIEKVFIEPGYADNAEEDPFTCSDAETMLDYLKAA